MSPTTSQSVQTADGNSPTHDELIQEIEYLRYAVALLGRRLGLSEQEIAMLSSSNTQAQADNALASLATLATTMADDDVAGRRSSVAAFVLHGSSPQSSAFASPARDQTPSQRSNFPSQSGPGSMQERQIESPRPPINYRHSFDSALSSPLFSQHALTGTTPMTAPRATYPILPFSVAARLSQEQFDRESNFSWPEAGTSTDWRRSQSIQQQQQTPMPPQSHVAPSMMSLTSQAYMFTDDAVSNAAFPFGGAGSFYAPAPFGDMQSPSSSSSGRPLPPPLSTLPATPQMYMQRRGAPSHLS